MKKRDELICLAVAAVVTLALAALSFAWFDQLAQLPK
jgi:hypothetical protein